MYAADERAPAEEPEEYEGFALEKYKSLWGQWADLYSEARRQSFRDQEYYDGDVKGTGWGQWSDDELTKLSERGQPPSVFNLVKRKINAISGVEQRSRAEPRALPRTPKDQKAAEIATDALRFVKERTKSGTVSALGFMDALIAGYGGSEIGGAEDHVPETQIPWRDIAFDPLSRRADFSDASWLAVAKWLDKDVALETYTPPEPEQPEPLPPPQIPPQPADPAQAMQWASLAQQIIARFEYETAQRQAEYERAMAKREAIITRIKETAEGAGSDALSGMDYEDHPKATFCDATRRRIFVVDMWHRDPKHGWYRCVFTGGGKLFTEAATLVEKDPLTNREIKVPPLKFFSLYVSKEGWRYGEVRGMRSPQDEVNKRRSKALHLLTVNQLFYVPGAFPDGDVEKVRGEVSRPDGVIAVTSMEGYRVERNADLANGQQQLGAEARQFMEMEGPNPQLQGEQGRATSGRAVLALQQAGLGQLGPIFDRKHEWDDARFRAYWARIQQFWTAPMYVRVTDDKNAARFAAVNGAQVISSDNGSMPPNPMGQMMPGVGHNGGPMGDPLAPQEQETGPMLAELDMDIIIDRAPEAATLQAEQFEELAKLIPTGALGPPGPELGRIVVSASALTNKSEILDMLDKMAQQPKQQDPRIMAELKKLEAQIAQIVAQTQKTKADTAKTASEIPKTQAETERTGAEARMKNTEATMKEFGALAVLDAVGSGFDPLVAADPGANVSPTQGGIGSPPI